MHFFLGASCKDHIRSVVAVDAGASVDRLGVAWLILQLPLYTLDVVDIYGVCSGAIAAAEENCGSSLLRIIYCQS